MSRCQVCGGRKFLAAYERSQPIAPVLDAAPCYQVRVKEYPCPACHHLVEPTHASVVSTVSLTEDSDIPAVMDEARKAAAHELAEQLLKRNLIDFAYTQMSFGSSRTVRATVYVVSPENVPDETSIAADCDKAIALERDRILGVLQDGVRSGKFAVYPFGDVVKAILGEN